MSVDLKHAHPNEPWLWRAEWAAGEIHSSARFGAIAVCALALFWNAIALQSAVPTLLAHNLRDEPQFAALAIFPIAGFGLFAWAIHLLLRWKVYGDSRFEMKSVPGKIGATLEGSILVGRGIEPMRPVNLKLVCYNHVATGDSGSDQLLWSDESQVTAGGDGSIPVEFLIPPECRPTDDTNFRDRIFWRLYAKSSWERRQLQIELRGAGLPNRGNLTRRLPKRLSYATAATSGFASSVLPDRPLASASPTAAKLKSIFERSAIPRWSSVCWDSSPSGPAARM